MNDNLLRGIPPEFPSEIVDRLVDRNGVRIERIVSRGHASAEHFWYDQSEHEWVLVVQGRAVIEFEDSGKIELQPGSWLDIPARRKHRVVSTSADPPTVWLAVFWT